MQAQVESIALDAMRLHHGSDFAIDLKTMRLIVWAVRGLAVARSLTNNPDEILESVETLAQILDKALPLDSAG